VNDPVTQLVLVSTALVTIVVAAACIPGIARVFLIAQAIYWTLSYVARPMVLLTVQPQPRYADNIADPRLAGIGYDRGIAEVLQPVAFGLWVYAGAVVAYAIWARRHRTALPRAAAGDFVPTLATVYALGLLGRAVSYVTGSTGQAGDVQSASPVLSLVAQLATAGAIGLIIFIRPPERRTTITLLGALLTVELMWTVVVESKTPIISAAMAVAVRFAMHGWTRERVVSIVTISVVAILAFGWLQSLKQPDYIRQEALAADAGYPPSVVPYLSILRRFDLLEAATDSYYMTMRHPWMTPFEVGQHGLQSLVPAQLLGTEKLLSGTAWATEVRGASMDMGRVSVSLADGNINEGFVVAGYAGVAVGVLFTLGLLLLTVRALLARHIAVVSVGLAITASPILFERGFLGSMEVIGKSLQLVVLVWLVDMVVREYLAHGLTARSPEPQPTDIDAVVGAPAKGWSE
jgi:hypothetical protein